MLETKVKTFVEDGKKIEKYKVLPFPDPELSSDTDSSTSPPSDHTDTYASESGDPMWKTEDEIECNTLKPSRRYQHIGSGKIARVYLEVLACNNLTTWKIFKPLEETRLTLSFKSSTRTVSAGHTSLTIRTILGSYPGRIEHSSCIPAFLALSST